MCLVGKGTVVMESHPQLRDDIRHLLRSRLECHVASLIHRMNILQDQIDRSLEITTLSVMRNSSSSSAFVTLIPTVPSALQLATMKLSETMQPSQILGTKHKLAVCILVPLSIGIVANNYSLRVNAQIVRRETGRRDQKPT